jgi:hypothetical protein
MDKAKEPFEVAKDYTNGFHITQEDKMEKRKEIYAQIEYLLNMLKQIDYVEDAGADVMSAQEVREYLKLDSIDPKMDIPSAIPKIRMGTGYVYYRRDIKNFLDGRRRGGI